MTEKNICKNPFRIVLCVLICCLVLNFTDFYYECLNLRSSFLRLHIIAASDSDYDQKLKLKVRDRVLETGSNIFNGSVTAQTAEERIIPEIAKIKTEAEKTLRENGCSESVSVSVKKEFFPERKYEDITLPAGSYEAVKIIIGTGKGHNWWCVMFPPLCLPAAEKHDARDILTEKENDIINKPQKYKAKLKLVEWIQEILDKT